MNRRKLEHFHQRLAVISRELADFIGDPSNIDEEEELIPQAVDRIDDALDILESLLLHT